MDISAATFRNGIEIRRVADRWHLANPYVDPAPSFATWQEVQSKLGTPPVTAEIVSAGRTQPMLLNPKSGRLFAIELSELMLSRNRPGALFHRRRLAYGLGAMIHHCTNIAGSYARICERVAEMSCIPEFDPGPHSIFQGNEEPYFEFDALVTAARRIYDAPSSMLWNAYGGRKGQAPNSLEEVLKRLTSLPEAIGNQLQSSWDQHGKRARDYRDSIVHWADIEHGLGSVDVLRHDIGVWAVLARLPDNPETRSRRQFTFARQVDALEYSIELTAELMSFVKTVADAALAPDVDSE